jgi:adenine-specific DNA-methyltransferase
MPAAEGALPAGAAPLADLRRRALADLIPESLRDGELDVEAIREAIGLPLSSAAERFGLHWPGRREAISAIRAPSAGTLRPRRDESLDFDASANCIIEGDNLEVMKLLQRSYHGRIKAIYIDPPYNTGKDFVYGDDFREGLADYLRFSGQRSVDGTRLTTNPEGGGRYHSKWLSLMYPRLLLARSLLREDGVLFASIDDHEHRHLAAILCEIFGEEHFIASVAVETNPKGRVLDEQFSRSHEYVLVFSKSRAVESLAIAKSEEQILREYTERDASGLFRTHELRNTHREFGRHNRPNLWYPIHVDPLTGACSTEPVAGAVEVWPRWEDGFEGCWTWGRTKAGAERSALVGRQARGRWKVYRKEHARRDGATATKKPKTMWKEPSYHTEKGQAAFDELLGRGVFQAPKPVELVKLLLQLSTRGDDLVLDFFAGSGTTAEAVMRANREDGGARRYLLVQLPEPTPDDSAARRAGFTDISAITRERARRAAGALESPMKAGEDRGFKAFVLDSSNFKPWRPPADADALAEQLRLHADHVLDGRSEQDLLFEILLREGWPLTTTIASEGSGTLTFHRVGDGHLLICLAVPLDPAAVCGAIDRGPKPRRLICLDQAFAGRDSDKSNLVLEMREREIEFTAL